MCIRDSYNYYLYEREREKLYPDWKTQLDMLYRDIKSGVLISILLVTGIALSLDLVEYHGVMSMPPSILPTFMQLDFAAAFELSMLSVIFAFLFVDLFLLLRRGL